MPLSPKQTLEKYRLKPQKKLGQHFLINPFTSKQIVEKSAIEPEDIVIEIGAGLGALTIPLAQRAKKVIAIEYDQKLTWVLKEILAEHQLKNVQIWQGDALKYDYEKTAHLHKTKIKIIGNLPYHISSPLLFLFLEKRAVIDHAILMLQKEVAERLSAKPGTKDFGILSILYGLVANIVFLMNLAPRSFYPPPEVDSRLIKIEWKEGIFLEHNFIVFLKYIFSQRRKTVLNALKRMGIKTEKIKQILCCLEIDTKTRPEQISPLHYVKLYQKCKT